MSTKIKVIKNDNSEFHVTYEGQDICDFFDILFDSQDVNYFETVENTVNTIVLTRLNEDSMSVTLDSSTIPTLNDLLFDGHLQRIKAINYIRLIYADTHNVGIGLAEAKDIVEEIIRRDYVPTSRFFVSKGNYSWFI